MLFSSLLYSNACGAWPGANLCALNLRPVSSFICIVYVQGGLMHHDVDSCFVCFDFLCCVACVAIEFFL